MSRVVFARIMSRAMVFICGISNRHPIITASLHTYSQQNTVKLPTSTRRRNQAPEFTVLVFESFGRKVNLDEIQSHPKRVIYSCHCCAEIEVSTVVFPTCHVSESC